MNFADYAALQAALANYLARDDLTAEIPTFIRLAEARMNRDLRVRHMETRAVAPTTAGDPYLALPADFLEMRVLVAATSPRRVVTFLTPQQIESSYADGATGLPTNYAIVGNELRIGPTPGGPITMELTYYAKVPALDGVAVNSNWVLAGYPDLYLYGALIEAEPFLQNDGRVQVWMGFYDRAIAAIKGEDARARWNGAPLQQRVDVRIV